MDKLSISGVKRLSINDDPNRVIEFNPSDVLFAERFYKVYRDFEAKQTEFLEKSKQLDEKSKILTPEGLPSNLEEGVEFLREVCTFMREKIDLLFGEGTSQIAFGDALSLEMIGQFFDGISPYVWSAREAKLEKHTMKHRK